MFPLTPDTLLSLGAHIFVKSFNQLNENQNETNRQSGQKSSSIQRKR